ncbi:MAG TPA: class I SAM-dependent methyltransferase family protein, partial [Candidatus Thermoplasmatota archaeon]|nr:class I SAM-dependent methyltransferase family protein [Candidatus Thermoplasmatota archaeon]
MKAPGIRVPREEGETVRRALQEAGLLRKDLQVRREGDHLVLPLTEAVPEYRGFPGVEEDFEPQRHQRETYQEIADVPADLKPLLPSSFDVIGHVLLLKLPDALAGYERAIAEALMRTNKSVRTVAVDRGVGGELRVRRLEVVAGEPETETIHTEHGMRLLVDPGAVYFSPRLSTERQRVAAQVKPGEVVVDLFAGAGPFAILLARMAEPAKVHAIDLNPEAYVYLEENIRRNRLEGRVEGHLADAREWARTHPGIADRVIMNLPHT